MKNILKHLKRQKNSNGRFKISEFHNIISDLGLEVKELDMNNAEDIKTSKLLDDSLKIELTSKEIPKKIIFSKAEIL